MSGSARPNSLWAVSLLLVASVFLITAGAEAEPDSSGPEDEPQSENSTSDAAPSLNLQGAVQRALSHNPELRAAEARLAQRKSDRGLAESAGRPKLNLSAGHTISNNPVNAFGFKLSQDRFTQQDFELDSLNDPDFAQNTGLRLSLSYPLYTFGEVEGKVDAAGEGVRAAELALQRTRREVTGSTIRAYLGAVLAKARVKVMDNSVGSAEERLRVARNFYENGVVVKSELLSAEAFLSEVKGKRSEAEAGAIEARQGLRQVLGGELSGETELGGSLPPTYQLPDATEELVTQALVNRLDLQALNTRERALESELESVAGSKRPTLALFSEYRYSDKGAFSGGSGDATFGLTLTQPLSDGGEASAKKAGVRARMRELQANRDALHDKIESEVRTTLGRLESARARISTAEAGVEQAEEALRITANRFREGMTTGTELREAETRLRKARLSRLAARYDWHAAAVDLLLASGDYRTLKKHYVPESGEYGNSG